MKTMPGVNGSNIRISVNIKETYFNIRAILGIVESLVRNAATTTTMSSVFNTISWSPFHYTSTNLVVNGFWVFPWGVHTLLVNIQNYDVGFCDVHLCTYLHTHTYIYISYVSQSLRSYICPTSTKTPIRLNINNIYIKTYRILRICIWIYG